MCLFAKVFLFGKSIKFILPVFQLWVNKNLLVFEQSVLVSLSVQRVELAHDGFIY